MTTDPSVSPQAPEPQKLRELEARIVRLEALAGVQYEGPFSPNAQMYTATRQLDGGAIEVYNLPVACNCDHGPRR